MKKIDIYSHFSFPRFMKFLEEKSGHPHKFTRLFANAKPLIDMDARLKVMDQLGFEKHVLIPLPEIGMTPEVAHYYPPSWRPHSVFCRAG